MLSIITVVIPIIVIPTVIVIRDLCNELLQTRNDLLAEREEVKRLTYELFETYEELDEIRADRDKCFDEWRKSCAESNEWFEICEKARERGNKWFEKWSDTFDQFITIQADLDETHTELRNAYQTIESMHSELQRNKSKCVLVIDEADAVVDDIHCSADDKALSVI